MGLIVRSCCRGVLLIEPKQIIQEWTLLEDIYKLLIVDCGVLLKRNCILRIEHDLSHRGQNLITFIVPGESVQEFDSSLTDSEISSIDRSRPHKNILLDTIMHLKSAKLFHFHFSKHMLWHHGP